MAQIREDLVEQDNDSRISRRVFLEMAGLGALAAVGGVAIARGSSAQADTTDTPVQSDGSAVPDDDVQGVRNAQAATTYFTQATDGFSPAGAGGYEGETSSASSSMDSLASSNSDTVNSRVLLVFFSRPGENNYGTPVHIDIPVGYTEVVAGYIADTLKCDTFQIQAAESYNEDYSTIVQRNVEEEQSDARPEIANLDALPDISNYDTVIVGSPVWNSRPPMIMRTFLESYDFTDKTIAPFTTYDMSGLGRAVATYQESAPGATVVEDGLAVYEKDANEEAGRTQVHDWLVQLGLLAE